MPVKAILTDIEGTTTSISFVKDKLFPYAVEHVQEYLTENWTDANVQEAVKELREQYTNDVTNKVDGAVAISDGEAKDQAEQIAEVVANVKWQISIDRKTTSLKKLQGLIWAKAYNSGAIKGHVYSDVPKAFERWTADNIKIYIYSSGSVAAQKLLFANSEHGDLTSNISGYFDTNIGGKQEKVSYEKIIKEVNCEPLDILFLTDIVKEAAAAKETGMKVALLVRSGNGPITDEEKADYQPYTSFDEIQLEFVIGKRKCDEILTAETNAVKIPKLSDEESVITNDTNTESVKETNGRTDSINDTKMETQVSNGNENETMKNDEKTDNDIPITINECDHKNKNVNLDVDVVAQDIIKGEKDSKQLTEVDEKMKINEALPMDVVDEKPSDKKETEDIDMEVTPIVAEIIPTPKADVIEDDESTKIVEVASDADCEPVAEPVVAEPVVAESVVAEPVVAEPVVAESVVAESVVAESVVAKSVVAESVVSAPVVSEPVVLEKIVSEPIVSESAVSKPITEVTSDEQTEKKESSAKESSEEIVTKNNAETTTDVSLKQNGDHTDANVEKVKEKIEDSKPKTENVEEKNITVESESSDTNPQKEEKETEKMESDEKVAASENGAKENEEMDNKENIPVEIKEKENIIEIPIHIDGDIQAAQKPTIVSATNGNGVASKDDLLETATAATNSNKEKMSRIELIIEEKNNDNGQLTETTTHIVKEITIVKNNVCESVENAEIMPENV